MCMWTSITPLTLFLLFYVVNKLVREWNGCAVIQILLKRDRKDSTAGSRSRGWGWTFLTARVSPSFTARTTQFPALIYASSQSLKFSTRYDWVSPLILASSHLPPSGLIKFLSYLGGRRGLSHLTPTAHLPFLKQTKEEQICKMTNPHNWGISIHFIGVFLFIGTSPGYPSHEVPHIPAHVNHFPDRKRSPSASLARCPVLMVKEHLNSDEKKVWRQYQNPKQCLME